MIDDKKRKKQDKSFRPSDKKKKEKNKWRENNFSKMRINKENNKNSSELETDEQSKDMNQMFSLLYGIGTKVDKIKAKEICLKLSSKGNLIAMGLMYFCGWTSNGGKPDPITSFNCFWQYYQLNRKNKAKYRTEMGYCLDLIGSCYEYGLCVPQNIKKAKSFYMKGSKLKNCLSMYNLAYCYELKKGSNNKKNLERAYNLYGLSAEKLYSEAIMKYILMCEKIKDTNYEKMASYLFNLVHHCKIEKKENLQKLQDIFAKRKVQWKEAYHMYWGASKDLNNIIFILLTISKFRKESKFDDPSFLVKGIVIKIIKNLCHF